MPRMLCSEDGAVRGEAAPGGHTDVLPREPSNHAQVHGFPKVMGVLTHLDGYKDNKALKKTKKALKHRFWAEIYQGEQALRVLAWVCFVIVCVADGGGRGTAERRSHTRLPRLSLPPQLSPCSLGAKLFYLSGIRHGKYLNREVLNLARFISVMKFRPLSWRLEHPYLVADRYVVGGVFWARWKLVDQ